MHVARAGRPAPHAKLCSVVDDDGHAIGYKVLSRGTPVRTSDGVQIGTVRRVQDNAREHIFDGIVIATPRGQRFVDAPEVARITENRVTLTIDAEEAATLPAPRRGRGITGPRWLRRLSR